MTVVAAEGLGGALQLLGTELKLAHERLLSTRPVRALRHAKACHAKGDPKQAACADPDWVGGHAKGSPWTPWEASTGKAFELE